MKTAPMAAGPLSRLGVTVKCTELQVKHTPWPEAALLTVPDLQLRPVSLQSTTPYLKKKSPFKFPGL